MNEEIIEIAENFLQVFKEIRNELLEIRLLKKNELDNQFNYMNLNDDLNKQKSDIIKLAISLNEAENKYNELANRNYVLESNITNMYKEIQILKDYWR